MKNKNIKLKLNKNIAFRAKPSPDAKVKTKLSAGTVITIKDSSGGWFLALNKQAEAGWFRPDQDPVFHLALKRAANDYSVPFINKKALDHLNRIVTGVWAGQPDRAEVRKHLQHLMDLTAILRDLAVSAHSFLNGDPNGEASFIRIIDGLTFRSGKTLPVYNMTSDATPFSLTGLPSPSFPGSSPFPCFFEPFAFRRIFEGVMRLSRILGDEFDQSAEEIYGRYLLHITPVINGAERLETLYSFSQKVLPTDKESIERFMRWFYFTTAEPISLEGLPFPEGPSPSPFPGFGGFFLPFDPCRMERWAGTVRAVHCFCREYYQVTRIVNLHNIRTDGSERFGEGCHGDMIEIQGNGFGDSRDWGLGGDDFQSQVIFSGPGATGIPAEDYPEWSDTHIQVRVPDLATSGNISLRILCSDIDVSECGLQMKLPRGSSQLRNFTIPERMPVIEAFSGGTPMWCEDFDIHVRVLNADSVIIRDEDGSEVLFPAGSPGPQRTIDGTVTVRESVNKTYTLTASNSCFEVSSTITVNRQREFYISSSGNAPAGETVTITLWHRCSPEHLGWSQAAFRLTYDDPDEVLINPPESMVVTGSNTEARVDVRTRSDDCGSVRVTATAEDESAYDVSHSSDSFFVYSTPHITSVRTVGANACDTFRFEVTGDCIILNRGLLTVRLTDFGSGDPAPQDPVVLEVTPGPDQPSRGVVVLCEVYGGLGTRTYNVTVEQYGLTSNLLRLTERGLGIPNASISSFSSSLTSIYSGGPVENTDLFWEVSHARRIEIWASGGRLGRGPGVIHEEDAPTREYCESWSRTFRDRIQFPVTYELRAYSYTGGDPVTRRIEVIDSRPEVPEPELHGLHRLRIVNCDSDRHTIHIWTRTIAPTAEEWEERGTLASGYDSSGYCPSSDADDLELTFEDGVYYELQIIDPNALTCDEPYEPTNWNCTRLTGYGPGGGAVILGDEEGYELVWVFPDPPPF